MSARTVLATVILYTASIYAQSPHGKDFRLDCSYCHVPTGWNVMRKDMKFNHNETSFKLTGQHALLSCRSCHTSLVFSDASTRCESCHKDVHQSSLGPDCARCHNPTSWIIPNEILLHQRTRFPLVGAHQIADCSACHSGYSRMYFPPINVACITCHAKDYYATTSPNHVTAGFSTQCQECHSISDMVWTASSFDHSFFPLVGGHNIQNCYACHTKGSNFKGLSANCYSCHQKDYVATTNPSHTSLSFSTDCSTCHTTNPGWKPATFAIHSNYYVIAGAHTTLSCDQCHQGNYSSAPTTCYGCHKNDYDGTTNPAHASAGFPTDCIQCHTQTAWTPSTFDHASFFPLTGSHDVSCSTCHINSSNFAQFSCTAACHSQAETDPRHSDVSNYVYSPTSCYSCHANGRGGD